MKTHICAIVLASCVAAIVVGFHAGSSIAWMLDRRGDTPAEATNR